MSQWRWRAYACLGICLSVHYFLDPSVPAQDIVYSLVGGLAVAAMAVRDIVDELRGSIEVTSEPGRGSTFTVTLVLRVADASEVESESSVLSAS